MPKSVTPEYCRECRVPPGEDCVRLCPLHAAAIGLLEALRGLVKGIEGREQRTGIPQLGPELPAARGALALTEGGGK